MDTIIGLDIGGTKFAIVGRAGPHGDNPESRRQVGHSHRTRLCCDVPSACVTRLCQAVELDEARMPSRSGIAWLALSVSIGGPLDIARGIIYSPPNLPGWDAVPLRDLLHAALWPDAGLSSSTTATRERIAEWRFGAGQAVRTIWCSLTMGTGLGGGLILNDAHLSRCQRPGRRGRAYAHRASMAPWPMASAVHGRAIAPGRRSRILAQTMLSPQRWGGGVATPEVVRLALGRR